MSVAWPVSLFVTVKRHWPSVICESVTRRT
jgi:hypothetical protein